MRNNPSGQNQHLDRDQVLETLGTLGLPPENVSSTADIDVILQSAAPAKSRSPSGESEESKNSGGSESHIFGMATPGKRKVLGQTMGFELRSPHRLATGTAGEEADVLKCVLTFGKERAPTIMSKGQGRHVSSHALLEEVLLSRLQGQDVEDAMDVVQQTVLDMWTRAALERSNLINSLFR